MVIDLNTIYGYHHGKYHLPRLLMSGLKNTQNHDLIFHGGEECKYTIHLPHSPVLLPIPTPGPTPDPNSGTTFPIPTPGPTSDPNSGTTSRSYLPIPTPGLLPRFPISIFPFRNHI